MHADVHDDLILRQSFAIYHLPNKPLDTKISRTYNMNTQEIHRNLPRSFPAADDSQFHNKCLSTLIRNSPNTARSRPRFARCDVQSAHAPLPGRCVSRPTVGELPDRLTTTSISTNRLPLRNRNNSALFQGDTASQPRNINTPTRYKT